MKAPAIKLPALSGTAGGYTLLLTVGVVGFLVIHYVLKKDVTDTRDWLGNFIEHPIGQDFDNWVYDLFHPQEKDPNPDSGGNNFGLTDPNTW